MPARSKYWRIYLPLAGLLFLPGIFFVLFGKFGEHEFETLPYYGPVDVVEKKEDGQLIRDSVRHRIPDFSFRDQDSNRITASFVDEKYHVAEFFQDRSRLMRVYKAFKHQPDIVFLSFPVDSMRSIPELKFYADRMDVDTGQWKFLHGPKKAIKNIAVKGYFKGSAESEKIREAIEHPVMVLVDKDRHIRGVYDAAYNSEISRLIEGIRLLKKAEDKREYESQ